jgi:hypothetical protein
MQNLTKQLRRIERGLEMLGAAETKLLQSSTELLKQIAQKNHWECRYDAQNYDYVLTNKKGFLWKNVHVHIQDDGSCWWTKDENTVNIKASEINALLESSLLVYLE